MKKHDIRLAAALLLTMMIAGCEENKNQVCQSKESTQVENREANRSTASAWRADSVAKLPEDRKKDATRPKAVPLTQADQERYDRAARKLVEAINSHDKKAYRDLHTDEAWTNAIDWWRDMFAAQVLRFGPIQRAYQPQRGMVRAGKIGMGGDERNGASFVVIFGKKVGGLFSFELNDNDKITHTSVFIKEELAGFNGWNAKLIYERQP